MALSKHSPTIGAGKGKKAVVRAPANVKVQKHAGGYKYAKVTKGVLQNHSALKKGGLSRNVYAKGTDVRVYRATLRAAPLIDRVNLERSGVPADIVEGLIEEIGVGTVAFQRLVRIPKATFTKKMKEKARFGGTTGQSVVGLLDLINAVEDMLAAEKDNPDAENFDVPAWVGKWITRPQPALGGLAPAELMDTPSGRESVMRVLGAIQSGAYQ
jgi:uncharacterized protein (DUF2384 family)